MTTYLHEPAAAFLQPGLEINCGGQLVDLSQPVVMGILNATPDSFFSGSRFTGADAVRARVAAILEEGGRMIDVGAYSSRPGARHISVEEESERLWPVLEVIRRHFPDVLLSVDTFRSDIACRAVEQYNVQMVNDISGGDMDPEMFAAIARLQVPYVVMHMQGTPQTMQNNPRYGDVTGEVIRALAQKVRALRLAGVNDIIIDPGFGFGKTTAHNYRLLAELPQFKLFELPLLAGLSRKGMVYKVTGGDATAALNGTTVLNTLALMGGANILRVHDVKEAVECVRLVKQANLMDP